MLSRPIRVVAWFPGPLEDTEHYFQRLHRLKQELDTSHCQIYEHKEEHKGSPPCAQYRHNVCHSVGEDGMETIQQHGTGDLLPSEC